MCAGEIRTGHVAYDGGYGRRGRFTSSGSVLGDDAELVGRALDEAGYDEVRLADSQPGRARRPRVVRARLGLYRVARHRTAAVVARRRPRDRHRVTRH